MSVVRHDKLLGDGKSDATTRRGAGTVGPVEAFEDVRSVFGINTGTVVSNGQNRTSLINAWLHPNS